MPKVKTLKFGVGDEEVKVPISLDPKTGQFSAEFPSKIWAVIPGTTETFKTLTDCENFAGAVWVKYREANEVKERVIIISYDGENAPFLYTGRKVGFFFCPAEKVTTGARTTYKVITWESYDGPKFEALKLGLNFVELPRRSGSFAEIPLTPENLNYCVKIWKGLTEIGDKIAAVCREPNRFFIPGEAENLLTLPIDEIKS